MLTSEDGVTKIQVNDKYLDGLVTLFEDVKQRKTLNEVVYNEKLLETAEEIGKFRSGVGTLLYLAGNRPDIQFHVQELASKLSKPTKVAQTTLLNVIGYMIYTKGYHAVMDGNDPLRSFRQRAKGLTEVPPYEENKQCWLLEFPPTVTGVATSLRGHLPAVDVSLWEEIGCTPTVAHNATSL